MTNEPNERYPKSFDELAGKIWDRLKETRELTVDAINGAIDEAAESMTKLESYTAEELSDVATAIHKEVSDLADNASEFGGRIRSSADPGRVGSGFVALASGLLDTAADALSELSDRVEGPIIYNTGEITGPGKLTCLEDGTELEFERAGRVPPCPKDHSTKFRRSY